MFPDPGGYIVRTSSLVLAGLVVAACLSAPAAARLDAQTQSIQVPGLSQPVEIRRDR